MKSLSEFELIKKFSERFSDSLPEKIVGIGDDCAVIPYRGNYSFLFTSDTLVDGVHFIVEKMRPSHIAYKSLTVNLSDIAAMGGTPLYVLLNLTVPPAIDSAWLDSFIDGLAAACKEFEVHLIGGDTTKTSDKLVITVTVIGTANSDNIKYRAAAKIDDYICVTGDIGDSIGGLQLFLNDIVSNLEKEKAALKKAHLQPRPHIKEGKWLASQNGVNAMIDISDGIESDIRRIMESSNCGAIIELTSLPLSDAFRKVAEEQKWDCYEMAATGGEDYCLMVTIDKECFESIARLFQKKFGTQLTAIGRVTERGLAFEMKGKTINLKRYGWDHFR